MRLFLSVKAKAWAEEGEESQSMLSHPLYGDGHIQWDSIKIILVIKFEPIFSISFILRVQYSCHFFDSYDAIFMEK